MGHVEQLRADQGLDKGPLGDIEALGLQHFDADDGLAHQFSSHLTGSGGDFGEFGHRSLPARGCFEIARSVE